MHSMPPLFVAQAFAVQACRRSARSRLGPTRPLKEMYSWEALPLQKPDRLVALEALQVVRRALVLLGVRRVPGQLAV